MLVVYRFSVPATRINYRLYKYETGNQMSNTRVPSVLWNADQTGILIDTEKRQARKNIGLVSTGSANLPVYFDANGDAKPMNSIDDLPLVKTVNGSKWAGWSAESSTTHYGVDLEIGGGQVNRGVWSKIPSSDNTSAVDDTWMLVKGTDRNSIFLNRAPGSLNDNKGGYAFGRLTTPNWDNIRTAGLYGIYASSTPGTNGSPDSGRVCLLVGDAYSVNSTTDLPGSNDTDHYNTQLAMGGDLFYRTKVGSASWDKWRPVLTQYKDTVTSSINGFKLATTTVSSTLNDMTHYSALINITPIKYNGNYPGNPYIAYLEIFQVKEEEKDRCSISLKMLSTPSSSDYNGFSPFVIRGSNDGSSGGNYTHDWYICRWGSSDTIKDFTITVTPLLYEGSVLFKGLERTTNLPTTSSYIITGRGTPAISNYGYSSAEETRPVYLASNGVLQQCTDDGLRSRVNGTDVGSKTIPVYINSNGVPTPCSTHVGTYGADTYIASHMYTSVEITSGTSGNAGGASTANPVTIFDEKFPTAYIPYGTSSAGWDPGIMMFVNASLYVVYDNTHANATELYVSLYQGGAQIGAHRYQLLPGYENFIPVSFAVTTSDVTTRNTHFYLRAWKPSDTSFDPVAVWHYTYNVSAMI